MEDSTAVLDSPATEPAAEIAAPDIAAPEVDTLEVTTGPTSADTPEVKAEDKPATADNGDLSGTLAAVNSHLKTITDPKIRGTVRTLATDGLRLQSLFRETKTDSLTALRNHFASGSEDVQQTLAAVKASDEALYRADPSLSGNVYDDMLSNDCADKYPDVVRNFVEHLAEVDPEAHTAMRRETLLSGLEECGFVELANNLSKAVYGSDLKTAKSLLSSLTQWFNAEAEQRGKQTTQHEAKSTEATAAATKAQATLRSEIDQEVEKVSRATFFANFPKGLSAKLTMGEKENLVKAARAAEAKALGSEANAKWRDDMSKRYTECKTQAQKREAMQIYQNRLKADAAKVMLETANKMFAAKMKPAPAVKVEPPTRDVTVLGKVQKVYQLSSAPYDQLLHEDIKTTSGVNLTSEQLSMLQLSQGIGAVKTRSNRIVLVQWKR